MIAIVAILAALLLPALGSAREMGRRSVCAGNLRQLSLALMLYVDDYDEQIPLLCLTHSFGHGTPSWYANAPGKTVTRFVIDYTGASRYPYDGIVRCPSAPKRPGWPDHWWDTDSSYVWHANNFGTYCMCAETGTAWPNRPWPAIRRRNLERAQEWGGYPWILFVDRTRVYVPPWFYATTDLTLYNNHGDYFAPSGGNTAYLDGSVRWLPFSAGTWYVNGNAVPQEGTCHIYNTSGGSRLTAGKGYGGGKDCFQGSNDMSAMTALAKANFEAVLGLR